MKILKIGAGVVVFAVAAVVAVLALFEIPFDVTPYKGRIETLVKEATGRTLTLEGDLTLFAGLSPRVEAAGASLSNASWGTKSEMVSASRLQVEIALLPALSGTVHVRRLILERPFVLLETRKDGRVNWDMGPEGKGGGEKRKKEEPPVSAAASKESPPPRLPVIDLFDLVDGQIVFKAEGEEEKTLSLKRVSLFAFNASSSSSSSSSSSFTASGAYNETAFDLSGTVEIKEAPEQPEPSYAVRGTGKIAGIDVDVDGVLSGLGNRRAVDVKAAFKTDGAQKTGPMRGLPAAALSGRIVGGGSEYAFEQASLSVGKSRATGQAKLFLAPTRPKIETVLRIASLDLAEAFPASKEGTQKAEGKPRVEEKEAVKKAGKVFSSAPLPWGALKSVDARFDVQAESVTLPSGQKLGLAALKGTLGNGVLTASSSLARRDGSAVRVELGMDASSGAKAAVRADGKAERLILADVVPPLGKKTAVEAVPVDASFSLKARGSSTAELMATLNGKVLVELGQGRIRTEWFDRLDGADVLRRLDLGKSKPEEWLSLTCGVVNLKADKGVLSWDRQVAFQTGKVDLVSSGKVDLGQETLDVRFAPLRWEGQDFKAAKIASLFHATGSLSQPKVELSAEDAARGALDLVDALRNKGKRGSSADAAVTPCATALLDSPPPAREPPPLTDLIEEKASKAIEKELKKRFVPPWAKP